MQQKCTRIKNDGLPCKRWAIRGGTVCTSHGGAARQVRAAAAVRADVAKWVPGTEMRDPGEVLLQLVTQAIMRAERYAEELDAQIAESPDLRGALVGDAFGEFGKVGEYIRGLAVLEAQERDRAAGFAAKAIAAGLAERQVRLAEKQGELLAFILKGVIENPQLQLSEAQKVLFPVVIREQLQLVGKKK
jgi:hypothetical protein